MLAFLWQLMAALVSVMVSSGVDSWSSYKATACALCCLLLLVCCLKDKVLVSMDALQARARVGCHLLIGLPAVQIEVKNQICSMSVQHFGNSSLLAHSWPMAFGSC